MDASRQQSDCPRCAVLEQELTAARSLIAELQAQVKALRQEVAGLRDRLDANSGNSSKPPSSDYFKQPRPRPPSGRKRGGQKGHRGHHRHRLPPQRVDEVVRHVPQACGACRRPLAQEQRPCDPPPRWHQVAELPPLAATVTEHQAHGRLCPCGKTTYASIPGDIRSHCFGPRLTALISYLSARCHDGKRTVQEILGDVFGVPIALGSVCAKEQEVRAALDKPYAQAARRVRKAPVKHVDETSWASCGQPRWLWVAATDELAFYVIHRRRNAKAMRRLLGPRQLGSIVTDRHAPYDLWPAARRQVCWAHLKRDFRRWQERGKGLGTTGLSICREVFRLWRDFRQGKLTAAFLKQLIEPLRKRMRNLLMRWRDRGPGKAQRFAQRLLACEPSLWTFARQQGVEPTNNHAERMLRPAVLWRKNSFGSQGQNGVHFAVRILTAVHSLRLQGRSVLEYLHQAVEAHRAGSRPPMLIAR
jgi:transposase